MRRGVFSGARSESPQLAPCASPSPSPCSQQRSRHRMEVIRMLDCVALCLAPPFIYYQATELSEYEAVASAGYGALASVIAASVKGVLTALYVPAGNDSLLLRAAVAGLISITDIVVLWYALTKFSHRNISNSHKFQAVALGWAAASALLFHTAPIVSGVFSSEFSVSKVLKACQANVFLAHMLSMAAIGVLFWSKRSKPAGMLPVLRLLLVLHAILPAVVGVLEDLQQASVAQAVLLHAAGTAVLAAVSYILWQQANPKSS